jgi:hypothetical protein
MHLCGGSTVTRRNYNAAAVDAAIAQSNRSGCKINGREAKAIHALLQGRAPRPYYTLAVRYDGRWSCEFGDYARDVVEQELQDVRDNSGIRKADLKIITTGSSQAAIDAAITALNEVSGK